MTLDRTKTNEEIWLAGLGSKNNTLRLKLLSNLYLVNPRYSAD